MANVTIRSFHLSRNTLAVVIIVTRLNLIAMEEKKKLVVIIARLIWIFPSTTEPPGHWVGVAHNVGDGLTFEIYDCHP